MLHRRAAAARAQIAAHNLPIYAGQIALHYREAGDSVKAARYAELAAEHALSVAAPAEAEVWYAQALELEPTPARQLGLAQALFWRGKLAAAEERYGLARKAYEARRDRNGMALVALSLAAMITAQSRYPEAERLAKEALALAGEDDPAVVIGAHVVIGTALRVRGALAEAEQQLNEAVRLAEEEGLTSLLTYAYLALSSLRGEQGDQRGAYAAACALIEHARRNGDSFYEVLGYNNAAHRATLLGDYERAHAQVARGLELAAERWLVIPLQWLYSTRGELALAEGELAVAADWFQRGIAEAERHHNLAQVAMYRANLARVAQGRGDWDEAAQLLRRAWEETDVRASTYQKLQIGLWLAQVEVEGSNLPAAREVWAHLQPLLRGYPQPELHRQAEHLGRLLA